MPGLLRGMARTAAVVGTANAVTHRQQEKYAAQDAQAQAAQQPIQQAAPPADDTVTELQQLAQLKDQGILTPEEFEAKKKQILNL